MKNKFLPVSIISHELLNYICSISGLLQLLESKDNLSTSNEYLRYVFDSLEKLQLSIEDISLLSNIESGRIQKKVNEICVYDELRFVKDTHFSEFPNNIEVIKNEDEIILHNDEKFFNELIKRVFSLAVNNSSIVKVHVEQLKDYVKISFYFNKISYLKECFDYKIDKVENRILFLKVSVIESLVDFLNAHIESKETDNAFILKIIFNSNSSETG
ncbi:hypothetical protein FHQ18_07505 [Deferribacter autotrophicus]|uniref:histidine kinase n=1 Tax=Deferribacter autotrophicus TaxID=500465 RepID=A0A5A8F2D2_9BACT|nr:histidine kinase dimerization/phospho-acceptor domain-containing protein [Deferribacter autotrophicus]KAA0258230.1 hypothetical protein FHQ18_07505 [Deferribacter autotrophicus]